MYPDLPPKGLYFWADAERFSERQKEREAGKSIYRHKGDIYTFGMKYDWSIDSVIGVSMNFHDSKLKSTVPNDERRDDIKGYMINAHYQSTLFTKYLLDAKFMYGRFENQASGWVRNDEFRQVFWEEDKHKSDIYGFSAKIGQPLIHDSGIKTLPEVGVTYTRLRGKAYTFDLKTTTLPYSVPKRSATSLTVPMTVTISKDFMQSWGLFTPRLVTGVTVELDDDATAVRVYNSSAAARVYYVPGKVPMNDLEYDIAQKMFLHAGVGVDVKTVGGWELSAQYTLYYADKYNNNTFRLELGRCF